MKSIYYIVIAAITAALLTACGSGGSNSRSGSSQGTFADVNSNPITTISQDAQKECNNQGTFADANGNPITTICV